MNGEDVMSKPTGLFEDWEIDMNGICELVASVSAINIIIPLERGKGNFRTNSREYRVVELEEEQKWLVFDIPGRDGHIALTYNISKMDCEDIYNFSGQRSKLSAWFIDKNVIYEQRVTKQYVSWAIFKILSFDEGDRLKNPKTVQEIAEEKTLIEKALNIAEETALQHGIQVRKDNFIHYLSD